MKCRQLLLTLALILFTAGAARADLEATLRSLDIHARADIGDFQTEVGVRLGASTSDVNLAFSSVDDPAHAAVCLWLSLQSRRPVEVVIREYRRYGKQGWGALAKSLGIRPGSPAFHALKQGNLGWQPAADSGKVKGRGKGNGKGKGRS